MIQPASFYLKQTNYFIIMLDSPCNIWNTVQLFFKSWDLEHTNTSLKTIVRKNR